MIETAFQRFILRIDCHRKARIGERIFMRAIELRLRRHCGDLRQRRPHLRGCPLEQSSATKREDRIADESRAVFREMINDMAKRMPGSCAHNRARRPKFDDIAVIDRLIDSRNFRRFALGTDDAAAPAFLQRKIAAGVIGVPVRVENVGERPTLFLKR